MQNCSKVPVECPNNCGVEKVALHKLGDHLKLCPLQNTGCDYVGCTTTLLRKDKEHHNCINMAKHLELVSKSLQESRQKVEKLEEKYALLVELVKVAVCTHQSLPWSVRILMECQLRNHDDYPFIVKIDKIADVKYQQSMVFSPSFYNKKDGYHLRLFLTSSPQAQSNYCQLLLGWQMLPGDHDNHLCWPINALLRLEVLNHLNDSHHIQCTGRANGIQRTIGHHSPPLYNLQTINGRINMDYCYTSDDIMYVRVLEITFEN